MNTKEQFLAKNLRKGEVYAGLLLGINEEPDQHIFLLPGSVKSTGWDDAKAWAQSIGGELPTRREQRLLFANVKDQFQATWYWSGEQHEADPDYAWGQYFDGGTQGIDHKSYAGRARAVRRLAI